MRNTVINAIHQAALVNKDIIFLTADLGYSVIENFQKELPNQCLNVGICEQNMIGVAAGLALSGKKVFVYTIVPFATMRCFEQIRVDVCYQNVDVTIIGVGGGFAYGSLGNTHYGLEDMSLMRTLPNMKIVSPSGPKEANVLFKQILKNRGPWYIRLNRGGEKDINDSGILAEVGRGSVVKNGKDVTIFSIGAITEVALIAAELLDKKGFSTELVHMHTLKPVDIEIILDRAKNRRAIITIEEHFINGALGSTVAEVLAENRFSIPFKRLGVNDEYLKIVGKQDYMRKVAGLSADDIEKNIINLCQS